MTEQELLQQVFQLPVFQSRYEILLKLSVIAEFPGLERNEELTFDTVDFNYLLSCASLLAQSKDGVHQDAALRIAQFSLQASENERVRAGGATVLHLLTNNPALELSFRRNLIPQHFLNDVPTPLRLDAIRRSFETSVYQRGRLFRFTRFQSEVFKSAQVAEWVSISAPTSAGKSYILSCLVGRYLDSGASSIAFIVPTRALIQQVMADLTELNVREQRESVFVTTMPQMPRDAADKKFIFVLTQERMHWLLAQSGSDLELDVLIVDEAQKISDGSRGILLQQVIEEAVNRFSSMRVLFSAPMTSNPELLLEDKPTSTTTRPVISNLPTVNQNLIWVQQQTAGKPKLWNAFHCRGEKLDLIGTFNLPDSPTPDTKRLPFVAFAMTESSANGGCLVYVNGQDAAEKTAFMLGQLRDEKVEQDEDVNNLVKLVTKTVHKDYLLNSVLSKRVGFHYGNMPLLIRTEIERLFKIGKIRYLVCTATLIEGVNLPAKYIFVRGPKKGRAPMNDSDFWNLAGRAGRLGTEFQGSVVCVDPQREEVWKKPPPREKASYKMSRALDDMMVSVDRFVEFLEKERVAEKPQGKLDEEHAFVYCATLLQQKGTLADHPWKDRIPHAALKKIEELIRSILETVEIDPAIIRRNPGVSPASQQRLLKYFRAYEDGIDKLIPFPPEDLDAVKESYVKVIGRISTHLSGEPSLLTYPRAILVVNWMRGYSLKRMIEENIKYWEKRGKNTAWVIRKTMEEVEQYARFRFVKYVSCYIDVLSQHFREIDRPDLVETIPQIQLYAEFGASQETHMSLMDLGLSRVSAIELSELIMKTTLSRDECVKWILETDLSGLSISPIVVKEIDAFKRGLAASEKGRNL